MLFIIFGSFAVAWRETPLFESKNNSDVHIISQYLDGGAWDSGDPDYSIKKTTQFMYVFRIVNDFDTTNIDRNIWIRGNKWK
jgi:hypothetical protein